MAARLLLGVIAALRWLGWRPLAALGAVSYGVYLWHLPLLLVARHAGLLPTTLGPRLLVVLTGSVAATALSWRWIERPWIERRRIGRSERHRVPMRPIAAAERAG
jgi:peptidoglycan/LPS O-acetylase OafA/YrhL